MTKEEERKLVSDYVIRRELIRPKTNIFIAFLFVLSLLFGCFGISAIIRIFNKDISPKIVFIFFFLLAFVVLSKKIIICVVQIYQHYSPELVRRKCICMPTCSEYMILAVKKYGTIRGVYKGIYRILKKCRGTDYKIDYP
jgi:putative component of membrane protein insertase Oxa1/YidC/SpoIIIJ protein YidD